MLTATALNVKVLSLIVEDVKACQVLTPSHVKAVLETFHLMLELVVATLLNSLIKLSLPTSILKLVLHVSLRLTTVTNVLMTAFQH
jgi:hypothetical protein